MGDDQQHKQDTRANTVRDLPDGKLLFVAPSSLIPHPENPRKHSRSQIGGIAKSIERSGYTSPIIVDRDMHILAGHGRREAALLLDLSTVPVIVKDDLSYDQAKAYMLADNKLTDRSTWDDHGVAIILKELAAPALDFDLDATGFETPEIDYRIQSLEPLEVAETADDFELSSHPPASTPGAIWHLGHHRLLCGDALDSGAVAALFAGERAVAAFTDPPYNVKIDGNAAGHGKTSYREFAMAIGEMSEAEFSSFLATALSNIRAHVIPGALIYACMDWRHMQEMHLAGRGSNLDLVNLCVWVKPNGRLGSFYKSRHELVFVFKNGREPHQNNIQLGRFGRNRTNVWNYSPGNTFGRKSTPAGGSHPTVKPLLMISDAILDCTQRNDLVFDPFLGSGTTLLAAERTGRRCFAVELDPLYVDTAIERWQRMTGRKAHNHLGETYEFVKSRRSAINE
jgi:DNA modification methylase